VTSSRKDVVAGGADELGVPVTVTVVFWLTGASEAAFTVTVIESPGMMVLGEMLAVVPWGRPLTERSIV